jgi:hypothetical protein
VQAHSIDLEGIGELSFRVNLFVKVAGLQVREKDTTFAGRGLNPLTHVEFLGELNK